MEMKVAVEKPMNQKTNVESTMFVKCQTFMRPQQIEIIEKALHYSELRVPDEVHFRSVKVYENERVFEIYTKNDKSLPHIVLLHGFGGTSLHFVRIIKALSQHYQVHALDMFGTGYSSDGTFRHDFTDKQAIHYYVDAIQEWRKAANIPHFELVGHSFGGYISTKYTLKFPKSVDRLVLLSPAGCGSFAEDQLKEVRLESCFNKLYFWFWERIYKMQFRPSVAMGNFFIGRAVREKMIIKQFKFLGEERSLWRNYLKNVASYQRKGQAGFYLIFKWPVEPPKTIYEMLQKAQYDQPIEVYYGDKDWASQFYSVSELQEKLQCVKMGVISQSGHQLFFDNPKEVISKILEPWQNSSISKDNQLEQTQSQIKQSV